MHGEDEMACPRHKTRFVEICRDCCRRVASAVPETRSRGPWPQERLDFALDGWGKGLSASAVADRLTVKYGVTYTRNAVIGQVNRHATPETRRSKYTNHLNRGHNARKGKQPRRPPRSKRALSALELIRMAGTPLPPRHVTDIARVSFNDMEPQKHCRFIPEKDPPQPFTLDAPHYCGMEPVKALPYCEAHARRCYGPPEVKERPSASAPIIFARPKEFA